MGKTITIEIKESPEELLQLSKKQKHPLAQACLRAFYLYKSGQASSCEQLSEQLGYGVATFDWRPFLSRFK